MRSYLPYLILAACLFAGFKAYLKRPIERAPGTLVVEEPQQIILPQSKPVIPFGQDVLQPLAEYKIRARLLGKEKYTTDPVAKYATWDLALGWKQMSDSSVLDQLDITQSSRFYFVKWQGKPPLPREDIFNSSANVHIIPADDFVKDIVEEARVGHVLELDGYLVRVDMRDGGEWKSSLSRADTGNGACEVMYVKIAQIIK